MSIKTFAFAFLLETIIFSGRSCVGQVYSNTYDTETTYATDEQPSTSSPYQPTVTLTSLITSSKDSSTTYTASELDHSNGALTSPSKSLKEETSTAYPASVTPDQPSSTLDDATNDSSVTSNANSSTVTYTSSYQPSTSLTSPSNSDTSATYSAFTSYQTTGNDVATSTANSTSGLSSTDMSSHGSNQNQTRTEVSTESGPSSPLSTTYKTDLSTTPMTTIASITSRIIAVTSNPSTTAIISNKTTTTFSNTTTTISTEPAVTKRETTTRPTTEPAITIRLTTGTTPHASTAGAMTSCITIYLTFASFFLLNNFHQP